MKIALLVVFCTSGALAMPVAIPNGGAEKVHEARADRPAGVEVWTSAGVDALFRRDTSVKRSGKASFYIRNHGTKSEGSAGSAVTAAWALGMTVRK